MRKLLAILGCCILLCGPQYCVYASVVISEVSFWDADATDWIEIYNNGLQPVDISSYRVSDADSQSNETAFSFGEVLLRVFGFAIVHFSDGADETTSTGDTNGNGYLDVYTNDTPFTATDDQAVLYDGLGNILDAVVWSNKDATLAAGEIGDANALMPGQWMYASVSSTNEYNEISVGTPFSGDTLARLAKDSETLQDTNTIADWHVSSPSMGHARFAQSAVPEPATLLMLAGGMAALAGCKKRRVNREKT